MRSAVLAIAFVLGCSRRSEPAITAEPAAPKVAASEAPPAPAKKLGKPDWSCSKDNDCTISCAWGAVNAQWLEKTKPRDCKDGCQELARAVCDHGSCVAVDERDAGVVVKTCTHIECPQQLPECASESP